MDAITPDIITENNIDITEYKINDNWWNQFLKKTNNFTDTAVIKDALSDTECSEMSAMVLKVIREVCHLKTNSYGFRVYIDGAKLNGAQLENQVFPHAPERDEQMESWVERVFQEKKFGMIINGGEKFSNELAQRLAIYAAPLLEKAGIPLNGLHSTIFIGNYGLTPLGIHQDHRGANVIHFHIGPGGKIMYTWDEKDFGQLLNGRDKKQVPVEELLPYAQKFPYQKGDIYFMPWNQFHIGQASEFSVGVTLWFDNHTRKLVLNNLFESRKLQYMNMNDLTITTPEKDLSNLKGYQDLKAVLKPGNAVKKKFTDFLKHLYEECMYSLFSNAGWSMRPLSMEEEYNYNENDYETLDNKIVKIVFPFKIHYRHIAEEGKLHIFARGSKIELNYHPEIVTLLDKLNEGDPLTVNGIVEQIFKELPKEVTLYVLSLLYNRRSISVVAG
jgi:hypothetical protein